MGKTIYDIALEIGSGLTPLRSKDQYWNSRDFPWVKTEQLGAYQIYDANEYVSETALRETSIKVWPAKTVSIAMYGEGKTRGNSSILMIPSTTNQACCNIVVDPQKADYRFLYYWLKNNYEQLRSLAAGVRKNLNADDIKGFPFPDFEVGYQSRIADALSAVDDLIENNSKLCESLESMAKTIYDYWFTQFDFPNAEGKPYRTSGGKMVWNEQLKREIPEKWEVNDILDLCEIIDCLHSKKPTYQYESDDTFLLTLENLTQEGYIDLSTKFYIAKSDYAEWTSRIEVRENDFVVTNAGRAGDIGKIPKGVKCAIGRNLTAIRPFAIEPYYMRGFFKSGYVQQQILTNLDAGSFFKSFNVKSIKKLLVLVPDKKALNAYIELITPIVQMIESRLQETQQLRDLRDWLLPMLMNGQATVE